MREKYLYEKIAGLFDSLVFSERKINLMYEAAKELLGQKDDYVDQVLSGLQNRLESLKAKESRLLDAFLAEQITKEIYDAKALELHNERVSLNKQVRETDANGMRGVCTLEPVKAVFMQANRAKKEFLDADDAKKREIVENLLWNLSIQNKSVAQVRFKSPFEIIAKAPKDAPISMLLRVLDEVRTGLILTLNRL